MSTPVRDLVLSEPLRWCRRYQQKGLLVRLDYDHQRIVRPVNDFAGAVSMPVALGREIRAALVAAGLPVAIVSHPRSGTWMFLTGTHDDRHEIWSCGPPCSSTTSTSRPGAGR
jgi:hypothetical protein